MSQPTQCVHIGVWRGGCCAPLEPPASRAAAGLAGERAALPPLLQGGALVADRRTVEIHARVSPAERATWRAKAAAAGVPVSALLRQAMARTWTATATDVERERTRQVARIGNNLNQLARWANIHADAVEAVAVIANLMSFERSLLAVTRCGGDGDDAH